MSRQRALRRAERQAALEKARVRRERAARRRVLLRRLRPTLAGRRSGRLPSRLSRSERAGIVIAAVAAVVSVWLLADAVSTRIALTALILLCVPAVFVLTADRRT